MADFADSQDRRSAMKEFLTAPATEEVSAQTPTDGEEVDTLEELLNKPVGKIEDEAVEDELDSLEDSDEGEEEADEEADEADDAEESEEDSEEHEDAEEHEGESDDETEIEPERLERLELANDALEGLQEAVDSTDYPIDFGSTEDSIAAGMTEVGLRLADAHALYDIVQGKGADGIFERVKQFQGQAAHDYALGEVLKYAAKVGLIEPVGGAASGTATATATATGTATETPREKFLREENERLKSEGNERRQTDAQQQKVAIFQKASDKIVEFCITRNLTKADAEKFILREVAAKVAGNKAIINRVTRGNFTDIQRFTDEAINDLLGKRTSANNQRVNSRKTRDRKVPKRVTGGERHSSATSVKRDLSTGEGRRAAVKAALRG
jgi:hypothetical protein